MSDLKLSVVTLAGTMEPIECDSVQLNVADNAEGKGGGSYGIHKGHIKSLFSLATGTLTALKNGETVLKAATGDGFATVQNDTVTVVVNQFETQ